LKDLKYRGAIAMNLSALFLSVSSVRNIPCDVRLSSAVSALFAFIANVIVLLKCSVIFVAEQIAPSSLFAMMMMAYLASFGNTAQPVGHHAVLQWSKSGNTCRTAHPTPAL
jgi:hypothetical protein